MPSPRLSARLLHAERLPPLHAWPKSAVARRGSGETPVPSWYMTPSARQLSRSPATHFLSYVAASSAGSTPVGASSRTTRARLHAGTNASTTRPRRLTDRRIRDSFVTSFTWRIEDPEPEASESTYCATAGHRALA